MGSNKKKNKPNNKKKNKPNKDDTHTDKNHHEGGGNGGGGERKIIADTRFSSVHFDPRFQKVSKQKSKVKIDSRFSGMFTHKSFGSSLARLDKRGKPKKKQQNSENSLKHYYRIDEDEEEQEKEKKIVSDEDDSEDEEKGDVAAAEEESEATDDVESEDDMEESTTDEEDEEILYEEDVPEVEVQNIPTTEDATRRLAVVNMDWRHVRAVDLYVVLRSFLPKGGVILSVAVYPSEFGLQCMEEEELHGPVGLFDDEDKKNDDDSDDDDDDDEVDDEKLRAYEKSRLR